MSPIVTTSVLIDIDNIYKNVLYKFASVNLKAHNLKEFNGTFQLDSLLVCWTLDFFVLMF